MTPAPPHLTLSGMFGFLHLAMLAGLAGLALPVLAHLLSKRKYDVVAWGAMQFLELGRKTRRRIRIEELLLLLLRMGLIALLALAAARPWAKGSLLAGLGNAPSRDVVYIIDGSYSMGWEGAATTPHAAAIQWVHESLERLQPGDTAALLDARTQVRPVVAPPTSDLELIRRALEDLPEPSGESRLPVAIGAAIQLLSSGANLHREIIVVSDGQALAWSPDDAGDWRRIESLAAESSVQPRLWGVNVGSQAPQERVNFSLAPLELSRELTVPGFTVRMQTTVRQSNGAATRRQVFLEVNGQRLDDKTYRVNLPANGEATVQFEHQFAAPGSYVVAATLEPDPLPGDNRAEAAVVISTGLPVLLVEGDPQPDPVLRETFYALSALTPEGVESPWVRARVVNADALTAADLEGQAAVFLCNVPRLSDAQAAALQAFVEQGGGLVVAPGDAVDPDAWNRLFDSGLLPARFLEIATEEEAEQRPVTIVNESLQAPWLTMFREEAAEGGFDLPRVRFSRWWKLAAGAGAVEESDESSAEGEADATGSASRIAARLTTGDPWLATQRVGRGRVVQLAAPVDASWSTLPGRRALAPLLHELVFLLAGRQSGRNVSAGTPLLLDIPVGSTAAEFAFRSPHGAMLPALAAGDEKSPRIRFEETALPGVYEAVRPEDPAWTPQRFVVDFDRSESDLTPLSPEQLTQLEETAGVRLVETVEELTAAHAEEAPRTELWAVLLLSVLGLLVFEVFLTRRLVQRGHEGLEGAAA